MSAETNRLKARVRRLEAENKALRERAEKWHKRALAVYTAIVQRAPGPEHG